jgi:hypothetical protein
MLAMEGVEWARDAVIGAAPTHLETKLPTGIYENADGTPVMDGACGQLTIMEASRTSRRSCLGGQWMPNIA